MDVHGPYLPGDEFTYRNKFRAERLWRKAAVNAPKEVTNAEHEELWTNYQKEVEYLDQKIGRLLADLKVSGDLANTAVVVVGDHGDEFMEHGRYGHGNLPYDELTHVPCLVRFPEGTGVTQPTDINDMVRTLDLLPTMLDLVDAGLSTEMENRMQGESLLPVIEGADPSYDIVVTEKEIRADDVLRIGFRTEEWKYLHDGQADEHLLYDLAVDPAEKNDVSPDHPDVLSRFRERLDARLVSIEKTSKGVDIPDVGNREDEAVSERLEALGYK
jgi:arylsulfatase A-like enzyme